MAFAKHVLTMVRRCVTSSGSEPNTLEEYLWCVRCVRSMIFMVGNNFGKTSSWQQFYQNMFHWEKHVLQPNVEQDVITSWPAGTTESAGTYLTDVLSDVVTCCNRTSWQYNWIISLKIWLKNMRLWRFLVLITGAGNQGFLGTIADLICFIKRIFETF